MPRGLRLFLDINVIGDDLQAKTGLKANIDKTIRAAESTILDHLNSYYSTLSTTLDQKATSLYHVMEQEVTAEPPSETTEAHKRLLNVTDTKASTRAQEKNANRQRKLYKLRQEKAERKEPSRTSRPRRRAPAPPFTPHMHNVETTAPPSTIDIPSTHVQQQEPPHGQSEQDGRHTNSSTAPYNLRSRSRSDHRHREEPPRQKRPARHHFRPTHAQTAANPPQAQTRYYPISSHSSSY